MMAHTTDYFVTGGTMRPTSQSYVLRTADTELYERVQAGTFCYVLTARQMGKSSLIVRTCERLQRDGLATVFIDLSQIGAATQEATWYLGLLTAIQRWLRLSVDVQGWWDTHTSRSASERFIEFLHDVALTQCSRQIVIFIDEIDTTFSLSFRDDFFAAVRSIYNARATTPIYNRLTFVLVGVATPSDLIQDRNRTHFNIGRQIELTELNSADAAPLGAGLEVAHPGAGTIILEEIFRWTGGHPYLTQCLCAAAAQTETQNWNSAAVDHLVEGLFFKPDARKDSNLEFVQEHVRKASLTEQRMMIQLYQRVLAGESVPDDDRSIVQNNLELAGLVGVVGGHLRPRNAIYRRIFDEGWAREQMPSNRERNLTIGIVSLAILIVVAVIAFLSRPIQDVSADYYVALFQGASNNTTRLRVLAQLSNLGFYEEARKLLLAERRPEEQIELFTYADTATLGADIISAVQGTYTALDVDAPNDTEVMQAMIAALQRANQPGSDALIKEIRAWREGRELAATNTPPALREAIERYNAALAAHQDNPDQKLPPNSTLLYDRAMAFLALGYLDDAVRDLETALIESNKIPPTNTPVLTQTRASGTQTSVSLSPTPMVTTRPTVKETTEATQMLAGATNTIGISVTNEPVQIRLRFVSKESIQKTIEEALAKNVQLSERATQIAIRADNKLLKVWNSENYAGSAIGDCYQSVPTFPFPSNMTINIYASCNNLLSSFQISPGWSVEFYEGWNATDAVSRCYDTGLPNLINEKFNDGSPLDNRVSSYIVYSHPNCQLS